MSDDKVMLAKKKAFIVFFEALIEVNFPLAVSGGIVRGTVRPWLGMPAGGGSWLE